MRKQDKDDSCTPHPTKPTPSPVTTQGTTPPPLNNNSSSSSGTTTTTSTTTSNNNNNTVVPPPSDSSNSAATSPPPPPPPHSNIDGVTIRQTPRTPVPPHPPPTSSSSSSSSLSTTPSASSSSSSKSSKATNPSKNANNSSNVTTTTTKTTTTKPSSTPTSTIMGMKHSKSDHSNLSSSGHRKEKSSHKKGGGGGGATTPMGKKFISKSQENLSNGKSGKGGKKGLQLPPPPPPQVTMVVEESPKHKSTKSQTTSSSSSSSNPSAPSTFTAPTTSSSTPSNKASDNESRSNKENQALKERGKNTAPPPPSSSSIDTAIFAKPKPVKSVPSRNNQGFGGGLRKASSTQSIDKSSSHQGGSNSSLKSSASQKSFNNAAAMKRAQSTQNISKDKFTKKRTSAPADVMAYNAELLANFEKEKKLLEVRISELTKVAEGRKVEIEKYKYEVKRLKTHISSVNSDRDHLEMLKNQNKQLNDRLHELGFPAEQITDNEKLMLKLSCSSSGSNGQQTVPKHNHQASSSDTCLLPASASCDSLSTDGGSKDFHRCNSVSTSEPGLLLDDYSCTTPDHPSVLSLDTASAHWEKQSNKSANSDGGNSEVSVACLTERILQMEETNYSTTEELQATLQELGDLQDAVNELTEDNSRLVDEKTVLLESLCTQTEKLEKTRIQLEQLKCLLISGELPDKSEMDGHLRGLLKSAAEEREELMRKQTEWSNALEGLEMECKETQEAGEALREKYSLLEATNKSLKADLEASEDHLSCARKGMEAERIEVVRLKTLLESERKKVLELETASMAQDKTDVETLLDVARRDKAQVEESLAGANERLAKSQCEITRLKDVLCSKDQELIVLRNNTYEERGKLQYEMEEGKKERGALVSEIDALRSHVVELEEDCDRLGVEKKSIGNKLQELQTELKNTMQQNIILEAEMNEMRSKHDVESEEWSQFQKDLQTAVVIANNFSQETKKSMETLTDEKTLLQDQVNGLQSEVERLKEETRTLRQSALEDSPSRKYPILTNSELKGNVGKVLSYVDRDLVTLREKSRSTSSPLDQRSQSISVKSLIRSIEEQVKSGCSSRGGQSSHSESRRSSTSSDISLSSLKELVSNSPLATPESPHSPSKDFALRASSLRVSGNTTTPASAVSTNRPRERSPQTTASLCSPVASNNVFLSGGSPNEGTASSLVKNTTMTSSGGGGGAGVGGGMYSTPGRMVDAGDRGDLIANPPGGAKVSYPITSILKDRSTPRRNSGAIEVDLNKKETPGKDPLTSLAKLMKGSKRNALLKWCQMKTIQYSNVDITNFSSSWNDGLAFCALLHCYVPQKIPYSELNSEDKMRNFSLAFKVGESIGIKSNLNINDMVCMERPDWQAVMNYVTSIYKHFEVDRQ